MQCVHLSFSVPESDNHPLSAPIMPVSIVRQVTERPLEAEVHINGDWQILGINDVQHFKMGLD